MQMSELKESYKMTVVKLHELTPKQFLSPTLNQKQPNRAPKSQSNPKIKSELKETKKMKIIALYKQTPKQFEPDPNPQNILNHNPTPMKAQFLPLFNVNLSQLNLNSISTKFPLNSSQPHFNPKFKSTSASISTSTKTSTLTSTQYGCDIKATQSCLI